MEKIKCFEQECSQIDAQTTETLHLEETSSGEIRDRLKVLSRRRDELAKLLQEYKGYLAHYQKGKYLSTLNILLGQYREKGRIWELYQCLFPKDLTLLSYDATTEKRVDGHDISILRDYPPLNERHFERHAGGDMHSCNIGSGIPSDKTLPRTSKKKT